MDLSPNDRCPCGTGLKYKKCCRPLHDGVPAPSAEVLMRSRYSAYAAVRADYIVRTTHPTSPHREDDEAAWTGDIRRFCRAMTFEGLTVVSVTVGAERATVEFEARMRQGTRDATMRERSLFFLVDGRWLYHSGERLEPARA